MKQLSTFFLIGVAQFLVDWGLFVIFYNLIGFPALVNILSRGIAATLGYYMNGWITFSLGHDLHRARPKFRFVLTWVLLTVVSTLLISIAGSIAANTASPGSALAAAKIMIEGSLFLVSFVVARYWIFKKAGTGRENP